MTTNPTDPVSAYAEGCRQYADATREELLRLALNAENESVRLGAIKELNDRSFGKPGATVEHKGTVGVIDHDSVSLLELARRIAFILARGAAEAQERGSLLLDRAPKEPQ